MKKRRKNLLRKLIVCGYIFLNIFTHPLLAAGTVVDKNREQKTNVRKAPNGVPVVDINAPGKNGVSHNYFDEYNVGREGIILNNSKGGANTQLGGIIEGNANLKGREADVILTEVTGANRSNIEGYTEVAGKAADYILANPNGIYLNGAGFINTPRVILTTGKSVTDEEGNLTGLSVEDGTVVVGSQGIDGKNVKMVDIISRTAQLNGAVYGGEEVNVILGRNDYDYETKKVTAKEEKDGEKPKVALDAKSLGSIYAGRIYLQSTEKGVGVNSEGTLLAGSGDVEIDVNGDLVLKDVQGKNNVSIKGENTQLKGDITAENSVSIKGKDIVNTGTVAANRELKTESSSLDNKGKLSAKEVNLNSSKITNNGAVEGDRVTIAADTLESKNITGKNVTVNVTEKVVNTGKITAEEKLDISGKKVENQGDILAADTTVKGSKIENSGNISGNSSVKITGVTENKSTGTITGDKITQTGNLDNRGTVQGKDITVTGEKIANSGSITGTNSAALTGEVKNQGDIQGKNSLKIKGETDNKGNIKSEGTLVVEGNLTNSGTIYGRDNTLTGNLNNSGDVSALNDMTVTGSVINTKNIAGGNKLTLQSSSVSNDGTISGGTVKITGQILLNRGNISGERLTINIFDIHNNGTIYGKNSVEITGNRFLNIGSALSDNSMKISSIESKNQGDIIAEGELVFTGTVENNKLIQGKNIAFDTLNNSGKVVSKEGITAKSVENSGIISAVKNISIKSLFNKLAGTILSGGEVDLETELKNKGIISLKGDMTAANVTNEGEIVSDGKVVLRKLNNQMGTIDGKIVEIENDQELKNLGGTIKGTNISIKADGIQNAGGKIQSQGGLELDFFNSVILDGNYMSNGLMRIRAVNITNNTNIENSGSVELYLIGDLYNNYKFTTGRDLSITAENVVNDGILGSSEKLEAVLKGDMTNNSQITAGSVNIKADRNIMNMGTVDSNGRIVLTADYVANSGKIISKSDLAVTSGDVTNSRDGEIYSENLLTITANGNFVNEYGEVFSNDDMLITVTGTLLNSAGKIESAGNITITADQIKNIGREENTIPMAGDVTEGNGYWGITPAYISSGKTVEMTAAGNIYNSGAAIQADEDIKIRAVVLTNENYTGTASGVYGAGRISAGVGRSIGIGGESVGDGILTFASNTVDRRGFQIGHIIVNSVEISRTGTIDTEDFVSIRDEDRNIFRVNTDTIKVESIEDKDSRFRGNTGNSKIGERREPDFTYLIETDKKFTDPGYYFGSEYFFKKIGYNPEKDIKILGDAFYETKAVNSAILMRTGRQYLSKGSDDENEQMKVLLDNSIEAMEDLQLSVGVALTKEQINRLKKDIIWYVKEMVEGVEVLVPKIYLSKETLLSLEEK